MLFRQGWLMAIAIAVSAPVFAQQAAPAEPAPAAPQAATPAPPSTDAKAANETTAAAAAPEAAKANPLTEGQIDADKIMAMQKAGYQIKNENGQILLCKRDPQTGSRLRHKTSCMTAREWEQLQEENKLQLKALERRPRMVPQ
jgi:cytoskeletal protein RodZ